MACVYVVSVQSPSCPSSHFECDLLTCLHFVRRAVSGQIELMLHRRLLCDDNRGVAEPLNETQVCAHARAVSLVSAM